MIDERNEELAALYAVGALDPEEARAFEAEMKSNDELHAFVDHLMHNCAALAHTVPLKSAPDHLKDKVLEKIRGHSSGGNVVPVQFSRQRAPWLPWAIAAALVVFCGVQISEISHLKDRLRQADRTNDVCEMQVAMLNLRSNDQKHVAVVVWDSSKQIGVLKGEDMPRPAANEDYQLWMMDPKYPQPVNAGIFSVDAEGKAVAIFRPEQPIKDFSKFVVSIEPKGGVHQHNDGPIVMTSK